MKAYELIHNAKLKAERFIRSGFAFLVLTVLVMLISATFLRYVQVNNDQKTMMRRTVYRAMEKDMAKCAKIGVKMQYAGAKTETELLPELKVYLYSLRCMNLAFYESFEGEFSPIHPRFLTKVTEAAERLERDLSAGYPTQESEKALWECLEQFNEIIDSINDG